MLKMFLLFSSFCFCDEWANKTVWTYGITSPKFDINSAKETKDIIPGEWTIVRDSKYYDGYRASLGWKEGCGWYDANKYWSGEGMYGRKDIATDFNLCWAGCATNILLWFFNNNKYEFENYKLTHNISEDFPANLSGDPTRYDPVYNFFRLRFNDEQSWCTDGVKYFLSGGYGRASFSFRTRDGEKFTGFIPGIAPSVDTLSSETRQPDRKKLAELMKNALKNKKAIGFALDLPRLGNHAMNIWGAEFDENGYVSYLYVADNNEYVDNTIGKIVRMKIIYQESSDPWMRELFPDKRYTFVSYPGTVGRYSQFNAFFEFDLGKSQWTQLN